MDQGGHPVQPTTSTQLTRLPSCCASRPVSPWYFYAPLNSDLPLVNTPPAPRPLGSLFHPKGDSAGDEELVDSNGHVHFRSPIEQDIPSHIWERCSAVEVATTLKWPIQNQSLWEQLVQWDAKTLRRLPGHCPAEDSGPPPPLPPRSSHPNFHQPPTPLPSTPAPSPESSPMPPFPPIPPSPMLRSLKWPSSQPLSPSSTNSDDVEIIEDNTGMAIETLTKDVEATEITSDDELEVMDIDQVTGRETETENMVGMEVDVGMPSTIVTKSSKQDVLHDDQDNSTHLHGKVEDAIQGWKERYQSLLSEVENERLWKGKPSMRHQWQSRLLSQVLEAQMLLGTSIDLMRDCLQKFKTDRYEVDLDVLA